MSRAAQRLRLRGELPRLFLAFELLLATATMAGAFAATSVGGGRPQRLLEANAAMDSLLLRQAVVVEGRQPADPATFERLSRGFDDALSRGRDARRLEGPCAADRAGDPGRPLAVVGRRRSHGTARAARPGRGGARALLDRFSARNAALAQRASSAQDARTAAGGWSSSSPRSASSRC